MYASGHISTWHVTTGIVFKENVEVYQRGINIEDKNCMTHIHGMKEIPMRVLSYNQKKERPWKTKTGVRDD